MTFSPLTDWMPVEHPEPGDLAVGMSWIPSDTSPVWPAGWNPVAVQPDMGEQRVLMGRVVDGTETWPRWISWEPGEGVSAVVVGFARAVPGGEGVGPR